MGCFSFMCKECGKPVLSNSFAGERVKLFLLKEGQVIQEMEGEYDSYGSVFIDDTQVGSVEHELRKSVGWKDPSPEIPLTPFWDKGGDNSRENHGIWHKVCDLMFSDDDGSGIAAIHSKCWTGEVPTTKSDDDPNQGWGEDWEYFGNADPEEKFD